MQSLSLDEPHQEIALLVLDMQEPFLNAIPDQDALISRVRFAVAAARLLGISIFFTEQSPDKLGHTRPDLLKAASGGSGTVFAKTTFSALGAPGLTEAIKDSEISHLLLAGIEIPICVYQTALQALAEDFDVTLLHDAVSGRRPADFAPVFGLLQQHEVCVLPSEAVFYSLLHSADHPHFRAFTTLVKEASRVSL